MSRAQAAAQRVEEWGLYTNMGEYNCGAMGLGSVHNKGKVLREKAGTPGNKRWGVPRYGAARVRTRACVPYARASKNGAPRSQTTHKTRPPHAAKRKSVHNSFAAHAPLYRHAVFPSLSRIQRQPEPARCATSPRRARRHATTKRYIRLRFKRNENAKKQVIIIKIKR